MIHCYAIIVGKEGCTIAGVKDGAELLRWELLDIGGEKGGDQT